MNKYYSLFIIYVFCKIITYEMKYTPTGTNGKIFKIVNVSYIYQKQYA